MPRHLWTKSLIALGLTGALLLFQLSGCSKKTTDTGDGGDPTADVGPDHADGGTDGGPDGSVPRCTYDDDCAINEICQNGVCAPAKPCQDDPSTCAGFDYCDTVSGLGCRCVKSEQAEAPYNGFCKRRLPACAPCTSDEQCGNDSNWFGTPLHNDGRCVTMPGMDFKVCLERFTSKTKCSCGESLNIDSVAYCAPQAPATCADGDFLCCGSDADCPSERPVCDETDGRCRAPCKYDFEHNETVGCPAGKVCHVLESHVLDPNDPLFGGGTCGKPCKSDDECKAISATFVCRGEANSDPRCRPAGCIDTPECTETPGETPYKSFCDRGNGTCICDPKVENGECYCRSGDDPVTEEPFDDCKPGFICDQRTCRQKNCVQQGGAEMACSFDEFCCGDDRDGDGNPDPCVDSKGKQIGEYGKCYQAPTPPWCLGCDSVSKCPTSGVPTSKYDVTLCGDLGAGPMCLYPCTMELEGRPVPSATQCPRGYACSSFRVGCDLTDSKSCGPQGTCKDSGQKDKDGNPIAYCKCSKKTVKGGECPPMPNGLGIGDTRCDDRGEWCIFSTVCEPRASNCQ